MCSQAGLSTEYTNHSLRAYGATSLFQAKVPEKLIQQRTGHKNLKALRQYERTSDGQLLNVSNIVSNVCGSNVTSSVSVESTVSISTPLSMMAEQSRYTAIARCVPQLPTPVSLSMANRKLAHSVLLSGCSFNNASSGFLEPKIGLLAAEKSISSSDPSIF